jgi:hypothetical protein
MCWMVVHCVMLQHHPLSVLVTVLARYSIGTFTGKLLHNKQVT